MNQSLESYTEIIQKLRGFSASNNLGDLIKKEAESASSSEIFRIKAEIKRLGTPSRRAFRIDQLFPNEDINFTEFELDGLVHHVEPNTLKAVQKESAIFGGIFTVGVEEHMSSYVKSNKSRILHTQKNSTTTISPVDISEVIYRKEERMHLGVRCEIFTIDSVEVPKKIADFSPKSDEEILRGLTQNISPNGLRLRTQSPGQKGAFILVRFTGLEKDFLFSQPYIIYECIHSERAKENLKSKEFPYSWALKKIAHRDNTEFDTFSKNLIKANKLRLNVDIDNVNRSVTNGIVEQFITNRNNSLSVFESRSGVPLLSLGNNLGKQIHDFFVTEGKTKLISLLHKDKINCLRTPSIATWVVIKQKDGSFFSAILTEDPQSRKFYRYCLSRDDAFFFQVFRSTAVKSNAFATHNLPLTANSSNMVRKNRRLTDFYSPNTREAVDRLETIITISPMHKASLMKVAGDVSKSEFSKGDLRGFSKLALKKFSKRELPFVKIKGRELRGEDRFKLHTPVNITLKGEAFSGTTRDISKSGAHVVLTSDDNLNLKGKIIDVDFHELETTNNKPLISYKVVRQDGPSLFLDNQGLPNTKHNDFWTDFLDENFNSLEPVQEKDSEGVSMLGLERALRNIKNSSSNQIEVLTNACGTGTSASFVNIPSNALDKSFWLTQSSELHRSSDELKKVFCDYDLQKNLSSLMKNITKDNPFDNGILLVSRRNGHIHRTRFFLLDDFSELKLKSLSRAAIEHGEEVHWYLASITRKSKIFDKYYREELDYIESCACHRAAELHNIIKRTTGVISLMPIDELIKLSTKFATD
jgi:hypothetical protein